MNIKTAVVLACVLSGALGTSAEAEEFPPRTWEIPLAGNTYITQRGDDSRDGLDRRGNLRWSDSETLVSIFFRASRPAEIDLKLRLGVPEGTSSIHLRSGETSLTREISGSDQQVVDFGRLMVENEGYVRVDLRGEEREGDVFAAITDLIAVSPQPDLELSFVATGGGNRFYWGRRGPSVHLGYQTPPDKTIEWFYSELTVPIGEDPIGSYFMANGFAEGYFGIQVNGPEERRVLFSVWSPFQTDNPADIPEDQQIAVLARGEGVRTGEFGNEGSGGQSFLVFPWVAGNTYQFLNRARPDGEGNTIYTAWFRGTETDGWRLIASFRRPKTDKHLTGIHSFLENFSTNTGHIGRRAWHGNQWARDTDGDWHELTRARFTGDDIANRGYRLDFAGGADGDRFFMRNCGFFDENVPINQFFDRRPTPGGKPDIALEDLEAFE
jgi:hypothetical protein